MNAAILVCTFGDEEWRERGKNAGDKARRANPEALTLSVHAPDSTLAGVRNLAANGVDADWLCFLDADDELAPGYIAAMDERSQALARDVHWSWPGTVDGIGLHSPLPLLVPAVEYVPSPCWDRPGLVGIPNGAGGRPLLDINCAVVGTLIHRRLFLQVGGFDPTWRFYEDWELWLRCVEAGAEMVAVPEAVYRAHVHDGSRHRSDPQEMSDEYRSIRAGYEHVSRLKQPAIHTGVNAKGEV